jgi:hypothetical protein
MVKIEIRTENVAGDTELSEALSYIVGRIEEGETAGLLKFGGEEYAWAVNPPEPLVSA